MKLGEEPTHRSCRKAYIAGAGTPTEVFPAKGGISLPLADFSLIENGTLDLILLFSTCHSCAGECYRWSYHFPAINNILCCSSPNSRCGCLNSLDDIFADASLDFMKIATTIAVGCQPTSLQKSAYIASSQRLPVISYLSRCFELFASANDGYPTPISSLLMKSCNSEDCRPCAVSHRSQKSLFQRLQPRIARRLSASSDR